MNLHRSPAVVFANLILAATVGAQLAPPPLHAPEVVLPVDSAPFQKLLDLDGDGDLDAVGTRVWQQYSKYELRLWRNDKGSMTLVRTDELPAETDQLLVPKVMQVATGDWNGDGRDDFVVGSGDKIHLFVVGNSFGLTLHDLGMGTPDSAWARHVAMGDVDGDGRDDVVFLQAPRASGPYLLGVHLAKGGLAVAYSGLVRNESTVLMLDTDGDPQQEIVLCWGNRAEVFDFTGGKLQSVANLVNDMPVSKKVMWMAGDVDGDKDVDLVVFNLPMWNLPPNYQVLRRTGTHQFTRDKIAVGGPAEYLADIDGDGRLDGVCCGGGGGGGNRNNFYPKLDFASQFEFAPGDGKGGFELAWSFPGSGSYSLAGVADLDGDGDVELVAGRVVFTAIGPWLRNPLLPTGANLATLRRRMVRDGDRDGDIDLMHNPYGGARGLGDGTFDNSALPGVAPPAGFTFAGGFDVDFDGDGASDQIVPMFERKPTALVFDSMVWLRNNGGGTYHDAGPVGPKGLRAGFGFTVDHFAHGDLDGDGDQDLVANSNPTQDGYRCEVFWNHNQRLVAGPAFASARFEGVADFDGDGYRDLLLAASNGLRIAFGTGSVGSPFGIPIPISAAVHSGPNAIQIADLNEDGRPDVAAVIGGRPHLFLNLPGGLTVNVLDATLAAAGQFLTVADFDGDRRADLIVGPLAGEPGVAMSFVARPNAGASRTTADYVVSRLLAGDGFAADVDGDGDTDLVGSRVLLGSRYHGAGAGSRRQAFTGTAGEGGSVPILGVSGALRTGASGALHLSGVPAPTVALLGVSAGESSLNDFPVPGATLRLDPSALLVLPLAVSGNSQGRGAGAVAVPYVVPAPLAGARLFLQAVLVDHSAPHGATVTNLLREYVGK